MWKPRSQHERPSSIGFFAYLAIGALSLADDGDSVTLAVHNVLGHMLLRRTLAASGSGDFKLVRSLDLAL